MRRPDQPIIIGIPALDYTPTGFTLSLALMIARACARDDLWVGFSCVQGTVLEDSRERIVDYALQVGASHLLMLDSDMQFPAETLVTLLEHDRDIVGASYCMRKEPRAMVHRLASDGSSRMPKGDELFEVESVGLGCMLIKTEVFRSVKFDPAEPFFRVERPTRLQGMKAEDVYFCHLLRKAGFRIWIDPVVTRAIGHIGSYVFKPEDVHMVRERDEA